ncbi:hypothetical protein D3880_21490 [Pseudomonas cavernae]|uniref:Uncharacterized protein n=1 Tax=Pseudomonas cavernae TaxID=2320867 RepID=A0A385Z9A6_9PSED|nr:hypothetical protein D3880_21490 [Pseudomonas cavernae]
MTFRHGRDGACFCAGLGARREVWSFQMSVEQRRAAQKQARPCGLRGNAVRDETSTDPRPTSARRRPGRCA